MSSSKPFSPHWNAQQFAENTAATVLYTMHLSENEPVADWVSENVEEITGYKASTLLQRGWWSEQIHPDDQQVEEQANQSLLAQGYLIYEYRWRFADGSYHWLRDEMRIIRDPQTQEVKVYGVWRDITPEKSARLQLIEQEERLRFTLQATGDGLWDWDIENNRIYWSETNFEMLGIAPTPESEITFEKWQQLVHPDDLKRAESHIGEALKIDGDKLDIEFRFKHADGHWLWVACRGQVVAWNEHGNPIRMLGLHTDISERKDWEHEIRARERLLKQLTEQVPGLLYQFVQQPDGHMYFPFASAHILEIYGVTPQQAEEDAWHAASNIHPDDLDEVLASIQRSGESLQLWRKQYRVILPGKGERWIRGEARPERQKDGSVLWHGYIMDVTAEREAERELRLASSVFKHTHEGIMITDRTGKIIEVNPTFTRITGYRRDDVMGEDPRLLASGRHSTEFFSEMWQNLIEFGFWQGEVWNKRKNGQIYCERKTISAVYDDHGNIEQFVSLFSDITQLKHQQQKLEQLAHYDPLTSLPNRTLLNDRLYMAVEAAKRNGSQLSVVYVDLDDFKPVNDQFGHATGDRLLEIIAERLVKNVRKSDTVARIGGDEFILLLNHESVTGYQALIKRLQKSLQQPVDIENHRVAVSSSIGIAHFPQDAENAELLIRYADRAMYAAKQSGKNKAQEYNELGGV